MIKYKAIIFDVGDTLVEYSPNYAQIFGDKIRALGIDVSEDMSLKISIAVYWASGEQIKKEQNGSPRATADELNKIMDEAALSCVTYSKDMKIDYLQMMSKIPMPKQQMVVIPGVIELLNVLKSNYRMAIVSNHYKWLINYLKEHKLYDYFESVIVSEVVRVEKPNVRIMEIVLNELNLPPKDCLYIGDHPLDVFCSKQAGMDCAWISKFDTKLPDSIPYVEDYKINKVTQLLEIL